MREKLLVFHNALAPYRIDFFNALNREYDTYFYFELGNVSDQKFNQDALKSKCDFECHYLNKGIRVLGRNIRLGIVHKIKLHQPEIIFCNEYGFTTIVVLLYLRLFSNKTKLYIISDDSVLQSASRRFFRAFLRNIILKRITGAIFTSEEVSNWHRENITSTLNTLELPIIHEESVLRKRFKKSIQEANSNIEKYQLQGKKVFLFVGRLVKVKNIEFLIKCFSKLDAHNNRLVIVGEGAEEKHLRDLVERLKLSEIVIFTGRKEDEELYNWYTFAQVFVLPSIHEPFGAVVNESLVGGCEVLCSNHAGAASLINSENGKVFDPTKKEELIAILKKKADEILVVKPILKLRANKMPFTFGKMIEQFFYKLKRH